MRGEHALPIVCCDSKLIEAPITPYSVLIEAREALSMRQRCADECVASPARANGQWLTMRLEID